MSTHNDIYSIVERLRVLEEGLDKNQRSVNQLSATFKPKTVAVLTAKTDPKNPMVGKLVGGSESAEDNREPVEEAVATEDVLDQVKRSFADYLKNVADEIKTDTDLKDKKHDDSDIKQKDKRDRDLISKAVKEDPTEEEPVIAEPPVVAPQTPIKNPTYAESAPVKTVTMEDGNLFEIHGNEHDGFEIRRGQRSMPSRFKNLDQAQMALEMFAHRLRKQNESQDYIDEA
jgi:hypothetical protein